MNMDWKHFIVVVCGSTAVGKRTLINHVLEELTRLGISISTTVSCTTRQPRKDEIHGQDYYFISVEEFQDRIKKGEFVEYKDVHGNGKFYGTLKSEVKSRLVTGHVIMEVDVAGFVEIQKAFTERYSTGGLHDIFITVSDPQSLVDRLTSRNGGATDDIPKRLKSAKREMGQVDLFQHSVLNDNLEEGKRSIVELFLKLIHP